MQPFDFSQIDSMSDEQFDSLLNEIVSPKLKSKPVTKGSNTGAGNLFEAPKPNPPGFFASNLKKGYGGFAKSVGGGVQALGSATGLEGLEGAGKDTVDYWSQFGREQEAARPSIRPNWENPISSTAGFIAEQAVQQVPNFIVGGGVGGGLAKAAFGRALASGLSREAAIKAGTQAAMGGVFGTTLGQETGSIYADQAPEDKSVGRALAAGIPAAAMEVMPWMGLAKRTGLPNLLGGLGGKEITGGVLRNVGKQGLIQSGQEAATEFGQTLLEQKGIDPNKPFDFEEAGLSALAGGGIGFAMGGAGGFTAHTKPAPVVQDQHTPTDLLQTEQPIEARPVTQGQIGYNPTPEQLQIGFSPTGVPALPYNPRSPFESGNVIEGEWEPQGNRQGFFGPQDETRNTGGYHQDSLDLTGSANPFRPQVPKGVQNLADTRNRLSQYGQSTEGLDLGGQIEMPTNYTQDNVGGDYSTLPVGEGFQPDLFSGVPSTPKPALEALKAKSKGKSTPKINKQLTEAPSASEDILPEVTNPVEQAIKDFVTEGVGTAEEVSAISGIPVEKLVEKRAKYAPVETAHPVVVKAKKAAKVKKIIEVESPSTGEVVTIDKATRDAKKLANATMGYEDTVFARDLHRELARRGKLSHKDIEEIYNANKDVYANDPALSKGKDVAATQKAYQDKSIETLYKALQDGTLDADVSSADASEHHFKMLKGSDAKTLGDWYVKTVAGKKKNKAQGVLTEAELHGKPEQGESVVTKADQARIRKAEAAQAQVTANAQVPHRIYRERMKSFQRALAELEGEVAKMPKGKAKTALQREVNKAKAKLQNHLNESNEIKLKSEYNQIKELENNKEQLDALKAKARDLGRLELEDNLEKLRTKEPEKDTTGLEKVRSQEEHQASIDDSKQFLDEMSKESDIEALLDNKDEIFRLRNNYEKEKAYKALKTDKDKATFLRNAAKEAYSQLNNTAYKGKAGSGELLGKPRETTKAVSQAIRETEIEATRVEEKPEGKKASVKKEKKAGPVYLKGKVGEVDVTDWSESGGEVSGRTVEDIKAELGNKADLIDVYQSLKDIPEHVKAQMKEDGVEIIDGFYDRKTGKLGLVADYVDNVKGAALNIFNHEIIHHGINSLGERGTQLLKQISLAYKKDIASMESSKTDALDRANEFLARYGESKLAPSMWTKVVDFVKDVITKATGIKFSDHELRAVFAEIKEGIDSDLKGGGIGVDFNEKVDKVINDYRSLYDPSVNGGFASSLTKLVDSKLSDNGLVKRAFNGLLRLQYWRDDLRPSTVVYGERQEHKINGFLKLVGDREFLNSGKDTISFKEDIAIKVNELKSNEKRDMFDLLILGDKLGKEFNSKKELTSDRYKNMSDASFELYKKTREFMKQSRKVMKRGFADAQAYQILGGRNTKLKHMQVTVTDIIQNYKLKTTEEIKQELKKQFKAITKQEGDLVNFDMLANAIVISKEGYNKYMSNEFEGYIPRERMENATKKVEVFRGATKVFSRFFENAHNAEVFNRELKANPMKYMPINYKDGSGLIFKGVEDLEGDADYKRATEFTSVFKTMEAAVDDAISQVLGNTDPNSKVGKALIENIKQQINNDILAQMGRQNEIRRSENLIEGFDEDAPLEAIHRMLSRTANGFAKSKYMYDQLDILHKADKKDKVVIADYIKETMQKVTPFGKGAQQIKTFTAIGFMGFRPLTALMQFAQVGTIGAAELSMIIKKAGIKTPVHVLLTKAFNDVTRESLTGKSSLSQEEKDMLDDMRSNGETFAVSSQMNMFTSMDDETVSNILGTKLDKVQNAAMWMFKQAEIKNRETAMLASYRVYRQMGLSTIEAREKALEYNNNTNFMLNRGNVPTYLKGSLTGELAYTLMSYNMNMLNWMLNRAHGGITDTQFDKKTQRMALMKMMGFAMVVGGLAGAPLVDDLNKFIRKFFGKDLKYETEQFLKKNAGKDIASLIVDGVFAPTFGVNISNNMAIRLPFVSGLLDDKTLAESVFGASGAMLAKGGTIVSEAAKGNYNKVIENAPLEAVASAARAYRLYDKGQRGPTGQPVFSEGKPIKLTGLEAIAQGLGVKSQRRADIMDTADTEFKLKKFWEDKRKNAIKQANEGNQKAIHEFNKTLLKDKTARQLVKPAQRGNPAKPDKAKTAFEAQAIGA